MLERRTLELSRSARAQEIDRKESELRALNRTADRKSRERKSAENKFSMIKAEAKKMLSTEKQSMSKEKLLQNLKDKLKNNKNKVQKEVKEEKALKTKASKKNKELSILKERMKQLDSKIQKIKVNEAIQKEEIEFDSILEQAILKKDSDTKVSAHEEELRKTELLQSELAIGEKSLEENFKLTEDVHFDALEANAEDLTSARNNEDYIDVFSEEKPSSHQEAGREAAQQESNQNSREAKDNVSRDVSSESNRASSSKRWKEYSGKLSALNALESGSTSSLSFNYQAEDGATYDVKLQRDDSGKVDLEILTKTNSQRFKLNAQKKIILEKFQEADFEVGKFNVKINKKGGEENHG